MAVKALPGSIGIPPYIHPVPSILPRTMIINQISRTEEEEVGISRDEWFLDE
jgi:hypothetical protein